MSTPSFVLASDLKKRRVSPSDYAVFGGTFDPFHPGHLSVVKTLLETFSEVIIAPTAQNPWKSGAPTPLPLRAEMIRLILSAEKVAFGSDIRRSSVEVDCFAYLYAEDFVNHSRAARSGELYWAVGEDSAGSVQRWRNWDKLGVTTVIVPVVIDLHATTIRIGDADVHPAIAAFVVQHGLYNSRDYSL